MRSFTFNTDSTDSTSALVLSYQNPQKVTAESGAKLGEILPVSLYLASPSNASATGYDALSGSATLSVVAALGQPGGVPTAGSYTLSFGANMTAALAYNSTAAQLQAALTALASIGANNVVVTGQFPTYSIQFVGSLALAAQALIQVQSSLLSAMSTVTISNIQIGSGVQNAIQSIILQILPPVYQATWTQVVDSNARPIGWTGTLNFSSAALAQMFSLGQPFIKEILEFTFSSASQTFKFSFPFTVNASVASIAGAGVGIGQNSMSGTFTIGNCVATGNVTGLGLATAPRGVEATVQTPAGGFVMAVTVDYSTITTDGFVFNLSGQTDSGNYKLFYTLIF